MPELPEVEVTRRRLTAEVAGSRIAQVVIRAAKLRFPVPSELATILPGRTIRAIVRRGKYLLFDCEAGWLIIHLGMTGYLRVQPETTPPGRHDHFELGLAGGRVLRLHDARKFGTIAWAIGDPLQHPLLAGIGPEPLSDAFDGPALHALAANRRVAIKQMLMNAALIAGIGNIYANEALFRARIRPDRPACSLTLDECRCLAAMVRQVLKESIDQGSTFKVAEQSVAYHPLEFHVYGRGSAACTRCGAPLESTRLGNRSTVFCPRCQV